MRTVCVKADQRNPNKTIEHGSKDCLPSENTKTFLEGGKLVVGVASVGGYWFFQILSCILPSVELV